MTVEEFWELPFSQQCAVWVHELEHERYGGRTSALLDEIRGARRLWNSADWAVDRATNE